MNDLMVILCYQNFIKDEKALDNLKKSYENLKKQGVTTFIVNIHDPSKADPKEIFPIDDQRYLKPYITHGPFWAVENAVNYFVKKLSPPDISKFVWMDSNVIIEDDKWGEKMSAMLDQKKLVHIGDEFSYLNEEGEIARTEASGAKAFLDGEEDKFQLSNYNLGMGWGANKDFFKNIGLFDFDVSGMGGNEAITFFSAVGAMKDNNNDFLEKIKEKNLELFFRVIPYNLKAFKYVEGNIGFLKGKVKSLYSGKYSVEKYSSRFDNVKFSLMAQANLSAGINTAGTQGHFDSMNLPAGKKTKECINFESEFYKYLNYVHYGLYKHPKSIVEPNVVNDPPPPTPPSVVPGAKHVPELKNPPPPKDPRLANLNPPFSAKENPESISSPVLKGSLLSMGENWKSARREVYEARVAYERALRKEEIIYNNFIRGLDNL